MFFPGLTPSKREEIVHRAFLMVKSRIFHHFSIMITEGACVSQDFHACYLANVWSRKVTSMSMLVFFFFSAFGLCH